MDTYSQILSNFKVFSKKGNVELSDSNTNQYIESVNYKWIAVAVLVIIVGAIYYKRIEFVEFFNSTVGKLLLQMHITSAGELATTYVPPDILPIDAVQ